MLLVQVRSHIMHDLYVNQPIACAEAKKQLFIILNVLATVLVVCINYRLLPGSGKPLSFMQPFTLLPLINTKSHVPTCYVHMLACSRQVSEVVLCVLPPLQLYNYLVFLSLRSSSRRRCYGRPSLSLSFLSAARSDNDMIPLF